MTKKKVSSAKSYVPYGDVSQIPQIIEQQVQQIPAYEDRGVKYQGKYKTQQSSSSYELRSQTTRFTNMIAAGLAAGATVTNVRPRNDLRFYCTKMVISWHAFTAHTPTDFLLLYDRKGTANDLRYAFFPVTDDGYQVINFTDCPRSFLGTDFAITSTFLMGATAFAVIAMYGWEEQN